MGDDRAAIERVVELYIDGCATGDTAKLNEAFHQSAFMFGALGGQRYDEPIGEMISLVASQPADTGNYKARIVNVEQTGDVACVEIAEDGFWGTVSFTDYFLLARIDGTWKIVSKAFTHTGGELPAE